MAGAQVFPRQPQSWTRPASVLDGNDIFLMQQASQFVLSGPRYVTTYRVPAGLGNLAFRADTYDTSISAIYLFERKQMALAADLVDGLYAAMLHDPVGDGRIVAATWANSLLGQGGDFSTTIFPGAGQADTGNMCWAAIAMARAFHYTGRAHYLHGARTIGDWVVTHTAVADEWGGFSGGYEEGGAKRPWRSVEHNTDAFALFRLLLQVSGEMRWEEHMLAAQALVRRCFIAGPDGAAHFCTGTGVGPVLNADIVPTDCQTWTALSGVAPEVHDAALKYVVANLQATSGDFSGVRFSSTGREVQNENTAGAALALRQAGWSEGGHLLASLQDQIRRAPGADGLGVVATPAAECWTGAGLGWSYFNWPHSAASAWTGLALLVAGTGAAENPNPFSELQPRPGHYGSE